MQGKGPSLQAGGALPNHRENLSQNTHGRESNTKKKNDGPLAFRLAGKNLSCNQVVFHRPWI